MIPILCYVRPAQNVNIARHFFPYKPRISSFHSTNCRHVNTTPRSFNRAVDVNTNVPKDVILFKYDNPRFFKILNIFALCQFGFWSYLSHFAFTTLKDAPVEKVDEDASWFRKINLGENKYRNTITVSCFLIGYGILAAAWLFSLRSVRFLILRKGGQKVSLVTYGPFGKNRIMEVPVNCISAQESRDAARVQLPLKVKNRAFYFILDMRGEFLNTRLYDHTAGLRRKL
ncbi:transmembrane protein 223 [Hermetia illucens]|uniref:transmembrane protein 223 n=1 Tax=Hermetia illucens TaxID=343691 RepID=UPI0018CC2049|nr:transmembrane protein 223 [Hermetia illucens]